MEADRRDDRVDYRRHRVSAIAFAAAILATLPIGLLVAGLLRLALGQGAAASWGPAAFAFGPLAASLAFLYGAIPSLRYRCPQCRGRADRVTPVGMARPNICYHCPRCAVIWDLGWGWGEPA